MRCDKDSEPMDAYPKAKPFTGVPSFFRACCMQASCGGGESYRTAGYHLAIHVHSHDSDDYDDEGEFEARLRLLERLLTARDRKLVLAWFVEEYPVCMRLVPKRRRQLFLDGVFQAFDAGQMEFQP